MCDNSLYILCILFFRLVVRGQENDCDYSSIKPQTNNKGYVKSKSNRPSIRTLSNNNSRQISHHTGNSRDFSCSRIVNSSRSNNNTTHYSSMFNINKFFLLYF